MSILTFDSVIEIAERLGAIFPMAASKKPLTLRGSHDATRDPATIKAWWNRWPGASPALLTGSGSAVIAVDIDIKNGKCGIDTLDELGLVFNPVTPTAHTPSGGIHWLFRRPVRPIATSATAIGTGVEIKGDRGWITLPPGPGRFWDPHLGLDVPLAPFPELLLRLLTPAKASPAPPRRSEHFAISRHAGALLDKAADRILSAPAGEQEITLNRQSYGIGQLVGAGVIPAGVAIEGLIWIAKKIRSYDSRHPWKAAELERKVRTAFTDGLSKPRGVRHG